LPARDVREWLAAQIGRLAMTPDAVLDGEEGEGRSSSSLDRDFSSE
jgi:hypothetical protein